MLPRPPEVVRGAGVGVDLGVPEGDVAEAVVVVRVRVDDDELGVGDLAHRREEILAQRTVAAGVDDEGALLPDHEAAVELELLVPTDVDPGSHLSPDRLTHAAQV